MGKGDKVSQVEEIMTDNIIQFRRPEPKARRVQRFEPCESCLTPELCLEPPVEPCALVTVREVVDKDPADQ